MISRDGDPGQRTGEFRVQARGDGSGGRTLRTGSALPLIQMVSLVLWAVCVGITWATGVVNGVAVLMVIFLAIFCWSAGAFKREFWTR